MADTTLPGLFATGDHASRPAASAVGSGALYSCTTHGLVYQSDGSSWTTWATLGGGAVAADDVSITDSGGYFTGTDVEAALQELGAGGGGGGLTQAYVGYNTIGASEETLTANRQYAKKITVASACFVSSVDMHIKGNGSNVPFLMAFVADDNSSTIGNIIAVGNTPTGNSYFLNTTYRWISVPVGVYLAAGDYWVGFMGSTVVTIHYDTGGSDRYMTQGGTWFGDGDRATQTDSTRKYSIRANTFS
jgi:hypothetical protein